MLKKIKKYIYRIKRFVGRLFGKKYAIDIMQERMDTYRGNLMVWIEDNMFAPIVQFGEKYNGRT